MDYLFENFENIKENDPEFHEIFKNFAYGEVFEYATLSKNDSILATLSCLIACQSANAFKNILIKSLNVDISPEEVKELLYQSVPYVGFARANDCFDATTEVFEKKGIETPLKVRSNANSENRCEKGRQIQSKYF